MNDSELSKRIDDVHKRLDDLRGDMNLRLSELRGDINARLGDMNTRLGELREDINRSFKILTWMMATWFSLLTILIVVFKFIR